MPNRAMDRSNPMSWQERLWANIKLAPGENCWTYSKSTFGDGYGKFKRLGKNTRAHRTVWEAIHGPIAEGLMVLHKCDNRPCCRPDHLFLGTHQDNMDDMKLKGRANPPSGENHFLAKLSDNQVRAVLDLVDHIPRAKIGDMFGVSSKYIDAIASGKRRQIASSKEVF